MILQLGSGRMKPVLLPPRASLATFLIPSSSKCLPELLGSRCQQSPSIMHNFTVYVHHVMRVGHLASSMVWRSLLYPSPPLPGVSRSSRFPCPMICRHRTWSHPPSGLCGPCSHCMQKAPWLLSRTYLALRRRYPLVANPRAGWRPVVVRSRRNWWSGLLPMP